MDASNLRIGAGALKINGTDVGYTTEEGLVVNYEPDVHLHLSGKFGTTPVKSSLVGQNLTIEVWIAENTLANIEACYAGVTEDGKIQFGGVAGREIVGATLELTPFDGTPSWYFRNAVPTSSVEANYKVNDERIIHVTFQALIAEGAPEGEEVAYIS